ncbi:MAG: hypothetical protein Q8N14_04370 [Candidatus Omnitrophota bacterium]|nr:hypothetical protein [Candidatus Omnitrophota bacterium]
MIELYRDAMKSKSLKLKVKSSLEKLFTVHCSLFTAKAGFTLIEIVMIIVVVSIAIPTLLIVLGQGARQSVDAELQVSATNVGQAMMEEIKTKCWDDTAASAANCSGAVTPSAIGLDGESRTQCTGASATPFDDVDDYNGYFETCSWGGPSYTTTVQVCYVPSGSLDSTTPCVIAQASATDFKRIQVTVSNPTLGSVNLVTLVGNY